MARLTGDSAAQLQRRAVRRRTDGSRGVRARRAWKRLVRACADGDAAAQEAVRAAELPDTDVLELLAVGPEEPADRAAYLALIGQRAQRRALDPDGSLLAMAYRAAPTDLRQRLRTVMAAEGDADVIRVVVTGDQRDRIAEMSYDELDYLARRLAERRSWDELRRLTRDLPLAKASAAARLLPEEERTGGADGLPALLVQRPAGQLRAMIDRLPHEKLIEHETRGSFHRASFSPDSSELAVRCTPWWKSDAQELRVETIRIDSGKATPVFRGGFGWVSKWEYEDDDALVHLGDEILLKQGRRDGCRVVRVLPDHQNLCPPSPVAKMRRSSGGAVLVCPAGLAFADRGANELRYVPVPRFDAIYGDGGLVLDKSHCALATDPGSRLIAFVGLGAGLLVMDESGRLLQETSLSDETVRDPASVLHPQFFPALSFLSPDSLALHWYNSGVGQDGRHGPEDETAGQYTEKWELPAEGTPRRTAVHRGAMRERWPFAQWRGLPLDDSFAARLAASVRRHGPSSGIDREFPWVQPPLSPNQWSFRGQKLLAMSQGGDMFAVARQSVRRLEVHMPYLPSARTLLERPLAHSSPQDLRRARELRTKIGDPAVRGALDLLAACLGERFGHDIALGQEPESAGGPQDIALGDGERAE